MTTTDIWVLVAALAATWMMTGVIWVIQLVHYPAFDAIERGPADESWRRFGDRHRSSISIVVAVPMAVEGITGIWLVVDPPGSAGIVWPLVAGALMAVAYGTTAFVSVPLHERMTHQWDAEAHRRLVSTNWIRTAAWTARAIVLAAFAVSVFADATS